MVLEIELFENCRKCTKPILWFIQYLYDVAICLDFLRHKYTVYWCVWLIYWDIDIVCSYTQILILYCPNCMNQWEIYSLVSVYSFAILKSLLSWCVLWSLFVNVIFTQTSPHHYTPEKINMEAKNHPFDKANHLNQTSLLGVPAVNFPGCIFCWTGLARVVRAPTCWQGAVGGPKMWLEDI